MSQDSKRGREYTADDWVQDARKRSKAARDLNVGIPQSVTFTTNPDGVDKEVNDFRYRVESVLQDVKDLLLKKNESYGNSALEPINVFSKASAVEQLKVRIDDKLNRLYRGKEYGSEDTVTDLLGYIVLLKIAEKERDENSN